MTNVDGLYADLIELADEWEDDIAIATGDREVEATNQTLSRCTDELREVLREHDSIGRSDDYQQGTVDTLEALIEKTHATQTQGDILFAAYESRQIPKAHVDEARERARELKDDD